MRPQKKHLIFYLKQTIIYTVALLNCKVCFSYFLAMKNFKKTLYSVSLSAVALFVATTSSLAASAYITPATGVITNKNFKVTLYVESNITEPEISSGKIKITYPASVSVSAITDGDFDTYAEKNNDTATKTITVNASNTTPKNGKIRLASISFEAIQNTGQVQLTLASDSNITGAGGEQLLTETVNGLYTLEISSTVIPTPTTVGTTTATVTPTGITGTNLKTGIADNPIPYLVSSIALIIAGVWASTKTFYSKSKK
jgi:hypothetical protein